MKKYLNKIYDLNKKAIKRNNIFLYFLLVFLIAGSMLLMFIDKGDVVIFLNNKHRPFLDYIFARLSKLTEGQIFIIFIIFFLFIRYSYSLFLIIAGLTHSIIVVLFKKVIFHGFPRPKLFLHDLIDWQVVDGIKLHSINSFPSGHATTIFALMFAIAIICNNRHLSWLFFSFACLSALSRIYLGQHFFVDVYFGAIIGSFSAYFSYMIMLAFEDKLSEGFWSRSLLKRNIKVKKPIKPTH